MVWHRTADRRVFLCYEEQTVVLLFKLQGGDHTEALSYEESAMSPIWRFSILQPRRPRWSRPFDVPSALRATTERSGSAVIVSVGGEFDASVKTFGTPLYGVEAIQRLSLDGAWSALSLRPTEEDEFAARAAD